MGSVSHGLGGETLTDAKALAEGLLRRGSTLVTGGTDNHLVLIDTRAYGLTGRQAEAARSAPASSAGRSAGRSADRAAVPEPGQRDAAYAAPCRSAALRPSRGSSPASAT